jgi:hypothetical protein
MQRQSRLLDFWGAISGAGLLLVLLLLIIYVPHNWYVWLVVAVLAFFGVEAWLRSRLSNYLLNVVIFLAIVTAGVLLFAYWRFALVLAVVAITRDNLRELFRR